MRRGHEEVLDVVLVLQVHAHDPDAAPPLLAVGRHRQPLDVAGLGDRDDHVLLRDHVLELEIGLAGDDLRAPVVGLPVDLLDLEQLLLDERRDSRLVAEQHPQLGDALLQVGELVLDALALEPGERAEPEVENRLCLQLGETEALHQSRAGLVGVVGARGSAG